MGDRKKHKTPIIPNDNAVNPKVLYLFFAEYLKHQIVNKISATIDVIIAKNGIESVSGSLSSPDPIESAIIKNRKIKLMIEDAIKTKYLIQFFKKSPPTYFSILYNNLPGISSVFRKQMRSYQSYPVLFPLLSASLAVYRVPSSSGKRPFDFYP